MTHYEMRRENRRLSSEEALTIFAEAEYCTISTVDADGMPYGVPLSFVLSEGKIYVHTTNSFGHKLENFSRDPRVCVSAVSSSKPLFREGSFTTCYESAIAFGRIRQLSEGAEFRHALVGLCMKHLPEEVRQIGTAIERDIATTGVWVIDIDKLSGKALRLDNKDRNVEPSAHSNENSNEKNRCNQ